LDLEPYFCIETPLTPSTLPSSLPNAGDERTRRRSRLKLLAVLLVCAAPVIASYFTYYVIRPEGRVNYGDLIEPQRSVAQLPVVPLNETATTLASFRGKWLMVVAGPADCDSVCQTRLYNIRQVRLTTGRERDRVERLWLLTESGQPDATLLAQHEGLRLARVDLTILREQFPAVTGAQPGDHIWLVDPLGNLMMRFPLNADPNRMKKDLIKLLRVSRVG
jgi:hypothetical protein